MAQGLALFDFDGTITRKDSLLEFLKFSSGKLRFILVMGFFSPLIFYHVFINKTGEIAKMMVLSFLFKGTSLDELNKIGKDFTQLVIPGILLPKAIEEINLLKREGYRIIVISASLDIWLKPWTDSMGIELLCTQMDFKEGKFTGKFATPNCNKEEKVNRITALLTLKDYHPINAYGNSKGDKPMLDIADNAFFRKFN